jgi:hypothetical protein
MVRIYRLNTRTLSLRWQKQYSERIRQKILAIEQIPEVIDCLFPFFLFISFSLFLLSLPRNKS